MPLLWFETTLSLSDEETTALADRVTELDTDEMVTTAGHVAVSIRERGRAETSTTSTSNASSTARCSF